MDKNGLQLKYFVLNPNKHDAYGRASRMAIREYAETIEKTNPQLAKDLYNWMKKLTMDILGRANEKESTYQV